MINEIEKEIEVLEVLLNELILKKPFENVRYDYVLRCQRELKVKLSVYKEWEAREKEIEEKIEELKKALKNNKNSSRYEDGWLFRYSEEEIDKIIDKIFQKKNHSQADLKNLKLGRGGVPDTSKDVCECGHSKDYHYNKKTPSGKIFMCVYFDKKYCGCIKFKPKETSKGEETSSDKKSSGGGR